MKYEVQGRVVGHAIFQPNPKDDPDLELVKIALVLSPATTSSQKHTKAILVVEKEASFDDLVLGRMVRLTLTDSQQDAFLPPPSEHGETRATVSMTDPKTGEVISAPLDRVAGEFARRAMKGGRARSRAH